MIPEVPRKDGGLRRRAGNIPCQPRVSPVPAGAVRSRSVPCVHVDSRRDAAGKELEKMAQFPEDPGGRCWDRTSDLSGVNGVLYR